MSRSIATHTTIVLLTATILATTTYADTLHVPGDYPTIQAGIDAAQPGDTVLVADDTYTGLGNKDLDFGGKAITVRSEHGPDNCIIDCEGDGRAFTFFNGETETSVVDGFTITNGLRSGGGAIYCDECRPTIANCNITANTADLGGGIFCDYFSDATILNCTITNNTAGLFGGGIYCWLSSPAIDGCTINENAALNCCGDGGAVHCDLFSHATITGCDISLNMAGRNGGGIYCDQSNPVISNCDITDNLAVEGGANDHGFGGGIYLVESGGTISGCTITGNWSEEAGGIQCCYSSPIITDCDVSGNTTNDACGGIHCEDYSCPTITNCTITGNMADDNGGGIGCVDSSDAIIANCTITGNSTTTIGGGIHCSESSPTIVNCTIADNQADSYGGGISCDLGDPQIINCTIAGNSAGTVGGGIACLDGGNPTITNCRITENSTTYDGGSFYIYNSDPIITNCTISLNTAAGWSASVYCDGGNSSIVNSILWNNTPQEIVVVNGTLAVTYSDVAGGWPGDGNLDVDPIFGHKIHFPQGPDPTGWDIYSNPENMLADDWRCSQTGLITDIHLWSSWCQDIEGGINYIVVYIHEDIPAGTGGIPYSRPGEVLWEWNSGGGYIVREVSPPSPQGWFDPVTGDYNYPDHERYFQYSMYVPPEVAFEQQAGTIYWLRLIAFPQNPMDDRWGWKSARTHWNDAAVYWDDVGQSWQPLFDPITAQPLDLAFVLTSGNDPADWENNDYRLSAGSQCIDAGDNTAVPADIADLDVDGDFTERTPVDLRGIRRFTDDPLTNDTGVADPPDYPLVVDMGAYEFGLRGDVDGDCDVDLSDLAQLLGNYGATGGAGYDHGDLDLDGDVDLADLAELLSHYGDICP